MIEHNLVIEIEKFQEHINLWQQGKLSVPENVDTITHIVRMVTGKPELELTKEQRQQVKMVMHGHTYGMSGITFIDLLKRQHGEY